jgi:hypothetical protein
MYPKISGAGQASDKKTDPRTARWQAGLEDVMALFKPDLQKGRLTPVCPLETQDLPVFKAALERVDLSPGLLAAFLPPGSANPIRPPDSLEELDRIEKDRPSYKIIVLRPGKENRLLCAEISEHAHRPGVDIFQSGTFLGNYDYDTHDVCIQELTKTVRAHAWERDKWQRKDYLTYTVNWFERTAYLGKPDVTVDKNYSFFHSPTLIRADRVDALFLLLYEVLCRRFRQDPEKIARELPGAGEKSWGTEARLSACQSLAQTYLLDLLSLVKTHDLLDFASFTNAQSHGFTNEFARTLEKLSADLDKIMI